MLNGVCWKLVDAALGCLAFLCLIGSTAAPVSADTCTWDGMTGNWNDSARWSCGHEPSAGDTALMGGGVVNVTAAASVDGLNLSGGTLQGDADLEVTVSLTWTAGAMSGTGKTIVPNGGTLSITGSGGKTLNRNLDNGGTATWSGTGLLSSSSATFSNLSTGTFTIQNDTLFNGLSSVFNNAGMVIKTGGVGETNMQMQFDQSATGSVDVQNGVLRFNAGGTIDGTLTATGTKLLFRIGTFTLAANATITATNVEFRGTTVVANLGGPNYAVTNTSVIGGVVDFNAPTSTFPNLIVSGGTINLNAPTTTIPNLTLSGGRLQGSGDVEVTTLLSWTGGSMSGTGKTIVPDGATLSISGSSNRGLERNLENGGTATWSGTGLLSAISGTFSNLSTGTFTIQNDTLFNGLSSVFNNAGMVIKTGGGGETNMQMQFDQSATGSVDVQDGVLRFNAGGTIDGTLTATGATLRFSVGVFTFSDELSFAVENLSVAGGDVDMSNINDLTLVNFSQSGGFFTLDHPGVLVQGDFVRTGGAFIHGKGRLIFGGETTQNLSLSAATSFFLVDVTANTTLVETAVADNATIVGFLKNRGTIRKTQEILATGNVTFGLTDVEIDVVNLGMLTELQVNRVGTTHPNAVPPTIREQYWELTPTGNSFEVDLTVNHCFQPQSELLLCQFTNPSWSCENQMSSPTSITQVGVTQFVDTALGSDEFHSMTSFECGNFSAWSDVRGLC